MTDKITQEEVFEALSWLREVRPRKEEFTRLVEEGARGDETFTMRLDGDDLAGLCHAVNVLYTYFDFDPEKEYWQQEVEEKCICDGAAYFTTEQNKKRYPFIINTDCVIHKEARFK